MDENRSELTSYKVKKKVTHKKRQCLELRKYNDEELEDELVHWIYEKRNKILHVRRKTFMWKATNIFDEKNDDLGTRDWFFASPSWCEKLMRRHGLSLRRKNTTAQKDTS